MGVKIQIMMGNCKIGKDYQSILGNLCSKIWVELKLLIRKSTG